MMSQHLNSMLEHLKMGSLIKTRPPSNENDSILPPALQSNDNTNHLTNTIDVKDCNNDTTNTETILANNHLISKINRSVSIEQKHQHHKSNEQIYNSTLTPNITANHLTNNHTTNDTKSTIDLSKFDPRKRYSVSVGHSNGSARELSPSNGRSGYRKLSQDIRLKGTANSLLDPDDPLSMGKPTTVIKPMKLKSMLTKAETYDTMHCKALEVSTLEKMN
jgi:hypothetical protein